MAYGKVLSDGLPLQETPSGRVLFQLKRGERFEIIEVRDGMRVKRWLRVRCYGRNGWVAEFDGRTGAMLVEYDALPPKLHVKMPRDFEQPIKPPPPPGWSKWFWLAVIAGIVAAASWLLFRPW